MWHLFSRLMALLRKQLNSGEPVDFFFIPPSPIIYQSNAGWFRPDMGLCLGWFGPFYWMIRSFILADSDSYEIQAKFLAQMIHNPLVACLSLTQTSVCLVTTLWLTTKQWTATPVVAGNIECENTGNFERSNNILYKFWMKVMRQILR